MLKNLIAFDKNISEKIYYSRLNKKLYKLIKLSTISYGLLPFIIGTLIIQSEDRILYFAGIILAFTFGILNEYKIKAIVKRRRPHYKQLQLTSFSFPSTHSVTTTIAFLLFANFASTISLSFIILAFLYFVYVILSRIVIGYHYLFDIIGGIILGLILILPIIFIVENL